MRAILDNRIRVPTDELPTEIHEQLIEALTIPSKAREKARKNRREGWTQMPKEIVLWDEVDGYFTIPRGFMESFLAGMASHDIEVEWDDRRPRHPVFRLGQKPALEDHQTDAANAMLDNSDIIVKAPPGAGKTVVCLYVIRELSKRTLIITHTKDLLEQWKRRADSHLGSKRVGVVAGGKIQPAPFLTIALVQTLWSRAEELSAAGFFDSFGLVILDECHHATAETFYAMMDAFNCYSRFGVSATPDKTGEFEVAKAVLGPVSHETSRKQLREVGRTIMPTVLQITTDFGKGMVGKKKYRSNNYNKIVQDLVDSTPRNSLIAAVVNSELCVNNRNLILTKRLEHIDVLEKLILKMGYNHPTYKLTSKQSDEDRKSLEKLVSRTPCVLLSTLADEGVDIPPLDRVHLAFPQRNTGLIEQQVGRGERSYPGKEDAWIIDYADIYVSVLRGQWTARWRDVYRRHGYEILRSEGLEFMEDDWWD